MKREKKFYVIGGLWFDSVNGNTYNSAKIIDEDGNIFYSRFCYGYGSAYMEEAKEEIEKRGIKNYKVINCGYFYIKKSAAKNHLF